MFGSFQNKVYNRTYIGNATYDMHEVNRHFSKYTNKHSVTDSPNVLQL